VGGRQLGQRARHGEARIACQQLAEAIEVAALADVVGLEVQDGLQLVEGVVQIDRAAREGEEARADLLEESDVAVDAVGDSRVLDLHRDGSTVDLRAVYLADAGGGCGDRIEIDQASDALGSELLVEHDAQHGEVDRLGLPLQLGEDLRGLGREEVAGVDGQHLPRLHERPLEAAQALGHHLGLLDARAQLGGAELLRRAHEARAYAVLDLLASNAGRHGEHAARATEQICLQASSFRAGSPKRKVSPELRRWRYRAEGRS
jgi:hypothetical protein